MALRNKKNIQRIEKIHAALKGKKITTFQVGDIVSLLLDKDYTAKTDNMRIFVRILEVSKQSSPLFRVQTNWGVLNRMQPIKKLKAVLPQILAPTSIEKNPVSITLSALTTKVSLADFVSIKCNCSKNCDTMRCRCREEDVPCSMYCYKGDLKQQPANGEGHCSNWQSFESAYLQLIQRRDAEDSTAETLIYEFTEKIRVHLRPIRTSLLRTPCR